MIDLAPHMAMHSQTLKNQNPYSVFEMDPLSLTGLYGRQRPPRSETETPDPLTRFLDPMNLARTGQDRSNLSTPGRNLNFEIPVMLNPGELLSTNSRQNSLVGDSNVHLHINAQVHMPGRFYNLFRGTA